MKKLGLMLTLALSLTAGLAHANEEASLSLDEVLVQRDTTAIGTEDEYAFSFARFYGDYLIEVSADSTCHSVHVDENENVSCVSKKGSRTLVGTLGKTVGRDKEYVGIQVNWRGNVIVKRVEIDGGDIINQIHVKK